MTIRELIERLQATGNPDTTEVGIFSPGTRGDQTVVEVFNDWLGRPVLKVGVKP